MTSEERDALLCRIGPDVKLGRNVRLYAFVNLYGCVIGDETTIGTFVEIQKGVTIGARCKVQSHTFICEGVTIEDEVFIGHNVNFINDRYPRAATSDGVLMGEGEWELLQTRVCRGAAIGTGSVILPEVTIGERAIVGAGSVVTKSVPPDTTVVGSPAQVVRSVSH